MTLRDRTRLGGVVALLVLGLLRPALAGPTNPTAEEKAGARAAATAANAAFADKKYTEALDKFQRAESLMHAPTHVLMIARTQVALGHLVSARESYTALTRETLAPNAPTAFKDAQTDAKKELDALEPRVPTIDVKVSPAPSDAVAKTLVITMDGAEIPPALVGIPHPVDPGTHVLQAHGDGVASDEKSIKVDEGAHASLVLDMKAAPGSTGAHPPAGPATGPGPDKPEPTKPPPSSGMKYAGYAGIGLGVVGIGVGAVFFALGSSKRGEANDAYTKCGEATCVRGTPEQKNVDAIDASANTKETIGAIGLIAGGALAAAGVTLLVLSPRAEDRKTSLWIGPGSAGVAGSF